MKTCLFISDGLNYIVFDLRRPSSRWHRLDVNTVTTVPRLLTKMRIMVGLEGEELQELRRRRDMKRKRQQNKQHNTSLDKKKKASEFCAATRVLMFFSGLKRFSLYLTTTTTTCSSQPPPHLEDVSAHNTSPIAKSG